MNIEELERLADLVKSSNIYELTLKQGDNRLTLRKPLVEAASNTNGSALTAYVAPDTDEGQTTDDTIDSELVETREPELVMVTASLVGVFRNVKPLIGLGAQVKEGQIIGNIAALVPTNEVFAPVDGRIVEALVNDGMPVEYGQELFAIEPASA